MEFYFCPRTTEKQVKSLSVRLQRENTSICIGVPVMTSDSALLQLVVETVRVDFVRVKPQWRNSNQRSNKGYHASSFIELNQQE